MHTNLKPGGAPSNAKKEAPGPEKPPAVSSGTGPALNASKVGAAVPLKPATPRQPPPPASQEPQIYEAQYPQGPPMTGPGFGNPAPAPGIGQQYFAAQYPQRSPMTGLGFGNPAPAPGQNHFANDARLPEGLAAKFGKLGLHPNANGPPQGLRTMAQVVEATGGADFVLPSDRHKKAKAKPVDESEIVYANLHIQNAASGIRYQLKYDQGAQMKFFEEETGANLSCRPPERDGTFYIAIRGTTKQVGIARKMVEEWIAMATPAVVERERQYQEKSTRHRQNHYTPGAANYVSRAAQNSSMLDESRQAQEGQGYMPAYHERFINRDTGEVEEVFHPQHRYMPTNAERETSLRQERIATEKEAETMRTFKSERPWSNEDEEDGQGPPPPSQYGFCGSGGGGYD
jgi:hypothetical protein